MWSHLDDALLDHRKIFLAGDLLGRNGPAIALGMYVVGLLWTNKHHSAGVLPIPIVKRFRHCARPMRIAAALVKAGLWEVSEGAYVIHDYAHWNRNAAEIKTKREHKRGNGAAPN